MEGSRSNRVYGAAVDLRGLLCGIGGELCGNGFGAEEHQADHEDDADAHYQSEFCVVCHDLLSSLWVDLSLLDYDRFSYLVRQYADIFGPFSLVCHVANRLACRNAISVASGNPG